MTQLRYPRITVTLGEKATDLLDTLRGRLDILTSAEIVTAALNHYEMYTRPTAETSEKMPAPSIEKIISARSTALRIMGNLHVWEVQQGGYEADCWEQVREVLGCPQKFSIIDIYDTLKALDDWGHFMGGWEADIWGRLEDFVTEFADHIQRLRIIMDGTIQPANLEP